MFDEEIPGNRHLAVAGVIFSTPVSSQKASRGGILKLKQKTRFILPSSSSSERTKKVEVILEAFLMRKFVRTT